MGPSFDSCGVYNLTLQDRGTTFPDLPSTIQLQAPVTAPDANGYQHVTVTNVSSGPYEIPKGFKNFTIMQYAPQGKAPWGPCANGGPLPPPPPLPQPFPPSPPVSAPSPGTGASAGTSPVVYVAGAVALAAVVAAVIYYSRQPRPRSLPR